MKADSAPYYAVIFSNKLKPSAPELGYAKVAEQMQALAEQQPGYLGVESVRDAQLGITVSYWRDEDAIREWRNHVDHQVARNLGREQFYQSYHLRVAKVEREYHFEAEPIDG